METAVRTHVVAIDVEACSNFLHLPPVFQLSNGDRVVIHTTPNYQQTGTEVITNFDLMLTGNSNYRDKPLAAVSNRIVELPRLSKTTQAAKLNAFNGVGQRKVKTFSTSIGHDHQESYSFGIGLKGKVVIKPDYAARGLAHWVVDTDQVQIGAFLHDRGELSVEEICNKYKSGVLYAKGNELYDGEAITASKTTFVTCQELITDVAAEYRVLTNFSGEPCLAVRRDRLGGEYKQASCGTRPLFDRNSVIGLPALLSAYPCTESFIELCRTVIGPMSSVDLFITYGGEWGVFEYCNQFGTVSVPRELAESLHKDYIEHLLLGPEANITTLKI